MTMRRVMVGAVSTWGVAAVLGFVLGLALAMIGKLREPFLITDSWSYIPVEQPLLHGVMLAITLVIFIMALEFGLVLAVALLRYRMLIGSVGAMMGLSGVLFFYYAFQAVSIPTGDRIFFGLFLGPCVAIFGSVMLWADLRGRMQA